MNNINFQNILTIAQAEKRLTRRLKRYWVFLLVAYFVGLAIFTYYSFLHALFSSFSATLGTINPHYLLSVYGLVFQVIFTIGVVFTAFDVRARDVRERIVEVLDCRPVSNLELIVGRFFALFQLAWIPVLILCCLLQFLGWVLPLLGAPIGNIVEWDSLITFALFLTLPAFFFSISLVFLVTLLVKNRVLSAIVSLGILGGMVAALTYLPIFTYPFWDNFGITIGSRFPTDMVSGLTTPEGFLQRIGFVLLGIAFLGFSAAIHPRLDDSNRPRTATIAGAILVAGLALLGASSAVLSGNLSNPEWIAAHEAVEDEAVPDIVSIAGAVTVDPGSSMQVEVQLEVQAPAAASLQSALFTLNPGFTIDSVTGANNQALAFTHANGLLTIDLPSALSAGQRTVINLAYSGEPDPQFAYIDSKLKLEKLADFNARGLSGAEPSMFEKSIVTLMPGNYWLPLAGNDINRDDTRTLGRDYFGVDIEIEVPEDWLVAGPGMRQEVAAQGAGNTRFRFAPQPQISEVALIASEFTRYAADIHGVHFEVLVYPGHTRNFDVLAPLRPEIEAWISTRLALAEDAGLVYPFDAFTLVEVPNGLRIYEGGWRMDTAMAPPAMMLMNESGFPTSRFDFTINSQANNTPLGNSDGQGINFDFSDSAKTVGFDRLLNFFTSDLSGGNVFMGMSRSYFSHHTAATGDEAVALNFILDMLATLVVSDERYYFSMYNDINATITNLINTIASGGIAGQTVTQRTIGTFADNVDVWNSSMDSSLANIDTDRAPEQTINLLTLKGGELAQAIYDVLGPQRAGEFLAAILQQHRDSSYRLADVVSTLATFDADLSVLFEETFNSTQLPGFVVDNADLYRLPDGVNGEQRFQLLVAVRNDEPVAGFTRISWILEDAEEDFFSSAPIRIDGHSTVEFGVVLSVPPASALVTPYVSLNRAQFLAGIFNDEEVRRVEAEPFEGVRSLPWDDSSERIIVDDLDPRFYVVDGNGTSAPDRVAGENRVPLDQGIRINQGNAPDDWNRIPSPTSEGKYRHTFVSVMAGEGDKKAVLPAEIPTAGLWDLEIYIPAAAAFRQNNMRGIWNLTITTSNGVETIAFDNRAAIAGWNLIGSFELPKGEATIEVTNKTDAIVVVVDAFAWTPVNTNSEAAQ